MSTTTTFVNNTQDGVKLVISIAGGTQGSTTNTKYLTANENYPLINTTKSCGTGQCNQVTVYSSATGAQLGPATAFVTNVSSTVDVQSLLYAVTSIWPFALKMSMVTTAPIFLFSILYIITIRHRISQGSGLFYFFIPTIAVFVGTMIGAYIVCNRITKGTLKDQNPYVLALAPTGMSMFFMWGVYFLLIKIGKKDNSFVSQKTIYDAKQKRIQESSEFKAIKGYQAQADFIKGKIGSRPSEDEGISQSSVFGGMSNLTLFAMVSLLAIYYGNVIVVDQVLQTCKLST